MKILSCGTAAGLVQLNENIMEENPFAKELEVLSTDLWIRLPPAPSQQSQEDTSPGTGWCFLLELKAVVIVEIFSVSALLQYSSFATLLDCFSSILQGFWRCQSSHGSVYNEPHFCLQLTRIWSTSLQKSRCARQQIRNRNEFGKWAQTSWLDVRPSWFFWDSGSAAPGKPLCLLYEGGDSFAGLYLFDFLLKIVKVWAKNVTLGDSISKPFEISRGKNISLLLSIRTVLKWYFKLFSLFWWYNSQLPKSDL